MVWPIVNAALMSGLFVAAQSPDVRAPEFEVATIKPSKSTGVSLGVSPGGLFNTTGTSLSQVIKFAYDLHPSQIIGGPSWLETERYDVTGKPDKPGKPDLKLVKAMVRKLLADRFQLTFHREKRELSVYAVTVARSGPKLTGNDSDPDGLPSFSAGRRELRLTNATMADFASILQSSILERPTVDQTGLGSARYDFTLKWTPDAASSPSGRTEPQVDNDAPDLFTAFQQQLGLKLESTKAQAEVLVIDHVERPSAN